eukprot:CAMPEP_0205999402 /NCGR_PEP_ID=MMETSP1464-20131121/829_1 /ASSEMBLY_ACC=CAM_ASM_001124 /TAXON_ID=119497 /ORGANISM="Exanthemachrysis gayraliae, Strain RCC1523" /LENGTH=375 /DNA_ID=CAMNT_0053372601 /DNA_START=16 /DNA_END=1143 /DNA_ORIENTATION=-
MGFPGRPKVRGLNLAFDRKYDIGEVLGHGSYATVRKCTLRTTGEVRAVKMIDKRKVQPSIRKSLEAEVQILKMMDHPNIIKLYDVYDTRAHLNLVTELATGGELFDRMASMGHYTEAEAASVVGQIARALHYMHDHGVTHRDLKPENVLLKDSSQNPVVKVSDFGLASVIDSNHDVMKTAVGTPAYVAPEVLKAEGYGPEVDLWSLGVVLYVLISGYHPFMDENYVGLYSKISAGEYEYPAAEWKGVSREAKSLIDALLVVDPHKRATAEDVLKHPWIAENRAKRVKNLAAQERLRSFQARQRLIRATRKVIIAQRLQKGSGQRAVPLSARNGKGTTLRKGPSPRVPSAAKTAGQANVDAVQAQPAQRRIFLCFC